MPLLNAIVDYMGRMLPVMLAALPFVAAWRLLRRPALAARGERTTRCHEVGLLLFVLFLAGLASLTVVPVLAYSGEVVSLTGRLNLVPFKVIADTWSAVFVDGNVNYFLINFLGNMVMFMPLGFFPALLWRGVGWRQVLLIGFGSSLFIEVVQLPFDRGSDVDDLWLNTLGALLGLAVCWLLPPGVVERFRVKKIT